MHTFFQAKVSFDGVDYEGACYSGETMAIRSLLDAVANALSVSYMDAADLLRGKILVVTL
jgi:hypothetical protein